MSSQTVKSINLINAFMIVIDCLYIVVFVASYCFYRRQQASIKEILNFFTDKEVPEEDEEENKKKKKTGHDGEDEEEEEGDEEGSEDESKSLDRRERSRGRKLTVENKLMESSYA